MDIAAAIERLLSDADWQGDATPNTEAAYKALRWADARDKPTWTELQVAWVEIVAEAAAVEYRHKRKAAYIAELGQDADFQNTVGDVLDDILTTLGRIKAAHPTTTPEFDVLATKVQAIKARFPKPAAAAKG